MANSTSHLPGPQHGSGFLVGTEVYLHSLNGVGAGRGWIYADASFGCRKAVSNHRGILGNFVGGFEWPQAEEDLIEFLGNSKLIVIVFCLGLFIIFFHGLPYVQMVCKYAMPLYLR